MNTKTIIILVIVAAVLYFILKKPAAALPPMQAPSPSPAPAPVPVPGVDPNAPAMSQPATVSVPAPVSMPDPVSAQVDVVAPTPQMVAMAQVPSVFVADTTDAQAQGSAGLANPPVAATIPVYSAPSVGPSPIVKQFLSGQTLTQQQNATSQTV